MLYPNPQIFRRLKTIFCHIPKTAGTSIEDTLRLPKQICGGHTTALAYRNAFPKEFHEFFKFTVLRDPLDRFLSAFWYLRQRPIHAALNNALIHACETPDEFVRKFPTLVPRIVHLHPAHQFVCDMRGIILVDACYRFESLGEAWKEIKAHAGLNGETLPLLTASERPPIEQDATPAVVEFVKATYARDYQLFGYPMP
jgi:hypothetical protein